MALSKDQIAQLWVQLGGAPKWAEPMAAIALRESGGRPKINNRGLNKNGTVDWGLFQVNDIWRKDPVVGKLFRTGEILTPEGGTKAAIRILQVQGPQAWASSGQVPQPSSSPTSIAPQQAAPVTKTVATPGVDRSGERRQAIAQFVTEGGPDDPDALLGLATSLPALKDTPAKARAAAVPATKTPGSSFTTAGSVSDGVRVMIERANKIDAKRLPYVWGGGHAVSGRPDGGTGRDPGIGFDCSGAVAAVLGIDPRHSSQFARWGKPGRAPGGKGVTVYANSGHVLMEINGRFFGTSGTNPQGGAGWIPRSAISPSYLAGFTARHL